MGSEIVSAGKETQAGFTLLTNEPVIVENFNREKRFNIPKLLSDHNVISGMSVIIGTVEEPYGILGAHTSSHRKFSKDDVNFLQSVANFSDPKGMLRAYISSRMNTLKSVSLYYEVFKNELLDHLSFIDQIREKYHKEEIMLVSRILSEGNEAGAFNVSNIELTAETIVTILKGSEIPLFLNSNPDDLDNKLNNLIHLIIHGISKPI